LPALATLGVLGALIATVILPPLGLVCIGVLVGAWALRTSLATVVVAYTVVLFVIPARYVVGPFALNAAMVLAFLAGLLWVGSKILPDIPITRGLNPVTVIIGLFLALILINFAVAHTVPMTTAQSKNTDRLTIQLFSVTLIAVVVIDATRTRQQLYRLLSTFVAMGTAAAFVGIIQFVSGATIVEALRPPGFRSLGIIPIEHRAGFARVGGTASHPIEMGIVWAVLVPLALHLSRFGRTKLGKRAALGAAMVMLLALPMAGSRSGFAAAAVALGVVATRWTFRRQANALAGLLIAALLVTMISPGLLGAMSGLISGKKGTGSLVDRHQAAQRAFALAGERPVFGQGFGSYTNELQSTVDNMWAEAVIEIGYVGMTAIALQFLGVACVAITARARTRERRLRDLALTLMAMTLGIAVAGWGLSIFKYPMVLGVLYLTFGCIGVVYRLASVSADDAPPQVAAGARQLTMGTRA
jgi:hypothetical protein